MTDSRIYTYAYHKGLKGCTTFRFNPEAFQGVLVKDKDLASTTYRFVMDDGGIAIASLGSTVFLWGVHAQKARVTRLLPGLPVRDTE